MADEVVVPADDKKTVETVSKAEFDATVKEANELKAKLEELSAKEKEKENSDLEQQGNLKGLVEKLRGEVKAKENEVKIEKSKISASMLLSQLSEVAKSEGCSQTEDLIKLIPKDELKTIQMGDNYKANLDDIKRVVTKMKADKGYMFQKNFNLVDGKAGGNQNITTGIPRTADGKVDIKAQRARLIKGFNNGQI